MAFATRVESLIVVWSMSTSKVTDMLVESATFSSFWAGDVDTMWGAWAETDTAQNTRSESHIGGTNVLRFSMKTSWTFGSKRRVSTHVREPPSKIGSTLLRYAPFLY